jgi:hypothetical protein
VHESEDLIYFSKKNNTFKENGTSKQNQNRPALTLEPWERERKRGNFADARSVLIGLSCHGGERQRNIDDGAF